VEQTIKLSDSKYIKQSRVSAAFSSISFAFLFTLYILPQYFGIPLPVFDFTVLRLMMVIMFLFLFGIRQWQQELIHLIIFAPYSKVLIPYLIVLFYTTVLRVDINAFMNPVTELLSFYLLVYIFKNCFGYKKTLVYIVIFTYILTSLGLIEYIMQRSPFSYLEFIEGYSSGRYMRSGYYRIMGPANHALGYGLMLITMLPIVCYDIEKEEINILKRKLLLIMVVINVFLTGSRSTLIVFFLEIMLLALFSDRINKKKLIIIGGLIVVIFTAILAVFQHTALAQYIFLQITSVVDEVLGTTYALQFGADVTALSDSSNYRDQLIYIFQIEWLNPLLGIGRNRGFSTEINGIFIKSVDSFYIAEFIRYAYPGMICYIVFLFYFLLRILKMGIQKKSQISKMLFIGALCYCINLLWLDSLQTLKYLYILFALFCCLPENELNKRKERMHVMKKQPSKYFK